MAKCSGITQAGTACRGIPIEDSEYCHAHHPGRANERRRHGSKGGKRGGRGRPVAELQDVKRQLRELAESVMAGGADRGDAAVAGQLYGTYIRAISVEVKLKEVLEVEERLAALEEAAESQNRGGTRWGA